MLSGADEKAVDFVQLSYVIYSGFREEFPEDHITPETTFRELGVQPHECECNLFVQVLAKKNIPSRNDMDRIDEQLDELATKLDELNQQSESL